MEKPTLQAIRDAYAVKKGFKDWESFSELANPSAVKNGSIAVRNQFEDAMEDYEDWLDSKPKKRESREQREMREALEKDAQKLEDLQRGIPKEHSMQFDLSESEDLTSRCFACPPGSE